MRTPIDCNNFLKLQIKWFLIAGSHHQPFSLSVSRGYVYWTDRTNTAVWKLPIDADSKLEPIKVLDMDKITPTGITSASQILSNDLNLECSIVVEPTMKVSITIFDIVYNLVYGSFPLSSYHLF